MRGLWELVCGVLLAVAVFLGTAIYMAVVCSGVPVLAPFCPIGSF